MLEMIMFGVTLTVSMVLASCMVFAITMKLMSNKKFMKKFLKHYIKMVTEITEETEDEE